MKARQLRLISCMENASKSFWRVHQATAFLLAISKWSNQCISLSWKVLWFHSNQISASTAFDKFTQINLVFFLKKGLNKTCWTWKISYFYPTSKAFVTRGLLCLNFSHFQILMEQPKFLPFSCFFEEVPNWALIYINQSLFLKRTNDHLTLEKYLQHFSDLLRSLKVNNLETILKLTKILSSVHHFLKNWNSSTLLACHFQCSVFPSLKYGYHRVPMTSPSQHN